MRSNAPFESRPSNAPPAGPQGELTEAYVGPGTMVNSGEFDGLDAKAGFERICESLEKKGQGHRAVKYRLRDWLISRQRYWGCPIPIVYCPDDGMVPVPNQRTKIGTTATFGILEKPTSSGYATS